jgi:ankyrin repeat protein
MRTLKEIFKDYEHASDFFGIRLRSVNQEGRYGATPIHIAVIRRDIEDAKCLLAAGADPNHPDLYGWTPLHFAALDDDAELVELLLKAGAKPDVANVDGERPVDMAKGERVRKMLEAAMRKEGA